MHTKGMRVDVLSEVLANCKADQAVTARFVLGSPFAYSSAGTEGALIRMSVGGGYWIEEGGLKPVEVAPLDLIMLPHGTRHSISSAPGLIPEPIAPLLARHTVGAHGDAPIVMQAGGAGRSIELFTAHLWLSAFSRSTVIKVLPSLIHVKVADLPATSTLSLMMHALVDETLEQRPGWKLSARRMTDLLLVNILRGYMASHPAIKASWLRGLTDPNIARAIMLIHRYPCKTWSIESLAKEVGMSRSSFSERFRDYVDDSPINYLTAHRMTLAATLLETENLPLSRIADQVGYASDKVLARAFAKWAGLTPTQYAKAARKRLEENMGGIALAPDSDSSGVY